jgi:hypothetical protein
MTKDSSTKGLRGIFADPEAEAREKLHLEYMKDIYLELKNISSMLYAIVHEYQHSFALFKTTPKGDR